MSGDFFDQQQAKLRKVNHKLLEAPVVKMCERTENAFVFRLGQHRFDDRDSVVKNSQQYAVSQIIGQDENRSVL